MHDMWADVANAVGHLALEATAGSTDLKHA